MHFKRTLAVAMAGAAAAVGIAASASFPATSARAATTSVQLPISQYSHMLVDPVHKHIFITSGAGYYTSGKIWFGYGAPAQGGIGSIDPSTSPATVTLNATNDPVNTWYAAPMLAASPNGELVAGEPGQSPDQLASYNVSSGTATVLAPEEFVDSATNL